MSRIRRHAAALPVALALIAALPVEADVRTFETPEHAGYSVSSCASANGVCGERVADLWCRQQGFERVVDWSVRLGRDFSTATVTLDGGTICRGAQCESFASISCETQGRSFRMPALGGLARSTLITPDRRNAEVAAAPIEYEVSVPGCQQREPGTFMCESLEEYRQCRILLEGGKVFGCRAGLAFADGLGEPVAAPPDGYRMELESNAEITVERGRRGQGRVRGDVRFEIAFAIPDIDARDWCLRRERYVYPLSGPAGGLATIDDTDACEVPVAGRFEPHEDDLIEAYDLCEGSLSWGDDLEHSIERLVGTLFHIGSARPDFVPTHGHARVVAPYVRVQAPLSIRCRE